MDSGFSSNTGTENLPDAAGIRLDFKTSSTFSSVVLDGVSITHSRGYALQLADDRTVNLTASHITLNHNGISGLPIVYLDGNIVQINDMCIADSIGPVLYIQFANTVSGNDIRAVGRSTDSSPAVVRNEHGGRVSINGMPLAQRSTDQFLPDSPVVHAGGLLCPVRNRSKN